MVGSLIDGDFLFFYFNQLSNSRKSHWMLQLCNALLLNCSLLPTAFHKMNIMKFIQIMPLIGIKGLIKTIRGRH